MANSVFGSFDPRLMQQDYSGIADAAKMQTAGMVGGFQSALNGGLDYLKQQKEDKAKLKASSEMIDAASKMFPSSAGSISGIAAKIKDENIPLNERAAMADQVASLINMSVGEGRHQQEMQLRQQAAENDRMQTMASVNATNTSTNAAIDAAAQSRSLAEATSPITLNALRQRNAQTGILSSQDLDSLDQIKDPHVKAAAISAAANLFPKSAARKAPAVQDIPVAGGTQKMQWDETSGQWKNIQVAPDLTTFVAKQEGFNPNAYADSGQTSIGYGTRAKPGEKAITKEEAAARLDQELAASAARVDKAIAQSGGQFNPNERNALVSFDYNTGAGESVISRFGKDKPALLAKMQEYNKSDKGDKAPTPGLVNRRNAETGLFTQPVGFTPSKPDFAAEDHAIKMEDRDKEQSIAAAAKVRMGKTIDKYMNPDGTPTKALDDAVGYGEGVGTFMGNIPFVPGGNSPKAIANQKELQLSLIEQSLLDAAKALKPVSNDEMKMLKANRPEITDKPEVWTQYMQSIKAILDDPYNYVGAPDRPEQIRKAEGLQLQQAIEAQSRNQAQR